jgi:hypothetical protein
MPLAAGLDWLEALLPLLFVGFWILSQIVTVLRKVGEQSRRGPAAAPRVEPVTEIERSSLEAEVREFLERMGQSRPPAGPPPLPESPQPGPVRRAEPIREGRAPQPATDRAGPGGPVAPVVRRPRPREDRPTAPQRRPVGSDVAGHVEDVFGHELRHLSSPLAGEIHDEPAAHRPTRRVRILEMLRSPTGLRDLVVIREILDRPPSATAARGGLLTAGPMALACCQPEKTGK